MAEKKTNAMRLLDTMKIPYEVRTYEVDEEALDGVHAAMMLDEDPDTVFKTLVTRGDDRQYYVFVIPVKEEIDLKKAARAVGVKSIEMIHVRELLPLTGYIRGGCSPVGMKKQFVTVFDETVLLFEKVFVSGGRRGVQICVTPDDLVRASSGKIAAVIRE